MEEISRIHKSLEINDIETALEIISRTDIKKLTDIEFKEFDKEISKSFKKFSYELDIDWDMKRKKYNYITNFILIHFDSEHKYNLLCRIKNWEAFKILEGGDLNDITELIEYLKRAKNYTTVVSKKELFLSQKRTGFNYDSPAKQTLIFLSFFYADLTEKIIKSSTVQEIEIVLKELSHLVSKIVYINEYSLNTGGGEEYFRSCILENNEYGISSTYIQCSEENRSNKNIVIHPELIDRKIIFCINKQEVMKNIISINPTSLHSIGNTIPMVKEIANELRIKTKIGYHFWTHFIDLDEKDNIEIIRNIDKHKLNVNFEEESKFIDKYFVSNFMLDVYRSLGGLENVPIVYPITTFDIYSINKDFVSHNVTSIKNVLQVNINDRKGGKTFFSLAEDNRFKKINFTGVYSEKTNDIDFAKKIEEGKNGKYENVQILDFTDKEELFRDSDLVLIPSLVDETFSRIAFEAIIRKKIVITSRSGNLKYINDGGIFLEENNDFKVALDFLDSEINLNDQLRKQETKIDSLKIAVVDNFVKNMEKSSQFTKFKIGIVSQIGPTGLGKLTQHLYEVFQNLGFSTYVLAALPYEYMGSKEYFYVHEEFAQIYKSNIQKSLNYREVVTDFEINNFIESFGINILIIPEIVNLENWRRISNLNWNNLSVISIPMLEIVNLKELIYYSHLTLNMHVTNISFETFNKYELGNNVYIGHAQEPSNFTFRENKSDSLNFLFVGGRNAFKRKNLDIFLEVFFQVSLERNDIHLTVTLSESEFKKVDKKYKTFNESHIEFKVGNFTNAEIENFIIDSDVGILLSKSEGLGLGFWDFNCKGIPVLTHNGFPHAENNDIVKNNNFVIAAKPQPLSDMTTGIFMEFDFDKNELIQFLECITKHKVNESKKAIIQIDFSKQFTDYQLRILKSLDIEYTEFKSRTPLQKIYSHFNLFNQLMKNIPLSQFRKIMIARNFPYDGKYISIFQSYFTFRSLIKILTDRPSLLRRYRKTIKTNIVRYIKFFNKF